MAAVREKDEWSFATAECGGQSVTVTGMEWPPASSVLNLDMGSQV